MPEDFGLTRYLSTRKALDDQAQGQAVKDVLRNSPDVATAIPELLKTGPQGIGLAKMLAEAEAARQNMSMNADILSKIQNPQTGAPVDPNVYRAIGLKMGLAGKVGGSALASEADRLEKLANEKAALTGMKSAPEVPAVGEQGPNVPAPAKPGVVPQYLLEHPIFGTSAASLQSRINSGAFQTPQAANTAVENLQKSHDAYLVSQAGIKARGEQARQTKQTAPAFDPAGIITPEARTAAAQRYNMDGTLPTNLGRGNQGAANTVSILNEAAKLSDAAGNDGQAARIRQIANKSSTVALNALSKDLAAIGPFHDMLNTNADIAIKLAKNIASSRTGSQFVNKPLTWLQNNARDNPDIAEYLFQMQIVKTEGARILNNPRLVGQLTDSARHEMDDVVNGNMPLGQTERVLNRMKADGDNRVNAMKKQREVLLSGMRGGAAPSAVAPSGPPPPAGFTPL